MCTGAQGEPSSILGRLSHGTYRFFDIKAGDTVVLSSHPIPGNEENVYHTIDRLFQRGANVIYEAIAPVHVSGHASQEEMKMMINLVRPKYFIPIHGELRQLKQHAFLAQNMGIPEENIAVVENGQVIEFVNGQMRLGEKVVAGSVFVDGSGVGDVGPDVMREREALARDGIVLVHLVVDRMGGHLLEEPDIISRGFIVTHEADEVLAEACVRITAAVIKADGNLKKDVEQAVRNYLYAETRRQPMVFVTVTRV
jgi:ribonuclease J